MIDAIHRHGRAEVEFQGDGVLIAFASAAAGVRCAIEIQKAVASYDEEHPEQQILLRIGLHTGEVVTEGGRFFGKSVILAARIAA